MGEICCERKLGYLLRLSSSSLQRRLISLLSSWNFAPGAAGFGRSTMSWRRVVEAVGMNLLAMLTLLWSMGMC